MWKNSSSTSLRCPTLFSTLRGGDFGCLDDVKKSLDFLAEVPFSTKSVTENDEPTAAFFSFLIDSGLYS